MDAVNKEEVPEVTTPLVLLLLKLQKKLSFIFALFKTAIYRSRRSLHLYRVSTGKPLDQSVKETK